MANEKDDDIEFDDGENFQYGNQGEITHDQLILQSMKRCLEEGSKEMRGGFFQDKADKFGNIKETYIDDQQKVYIRCISSLYNALIPKFDAIFIKEDELFKKKLKDIKERAMSILKLKLEQIEAKEKNEGVTYTELKDNLRNQIITGLLDQDSFEAQMVKDATFEAYEELLRSLIRCYTRKGFGGEQVLDAGAPSSNSNLG